MESQKAKLIEFLSGHSLPAFPLFTTTQGKCSCGKPSCASAGKHPFYRKNWKNLGSFEKSKLDMWFGNPDKFNLAVSTGRWSPSHGKFLVVIDVDAQEHPILEKLPRTFSYRTGSRGHHFWFWSSFPIANSVSKLAPSVDVRGENGYVVIPPSRHVSGLNYELPEESCWDIADLPVFVLEVLDQKNQAKQKTARPMTEGIIPSLGKVKSNIDPLEIQKWTDVSVSEIRKMLAQGRSIPNGIRNSVIHRLLSSDRAQGHTETQLLANSKKYVAQASSMETSPVTDVELRATLNQVLKYQARNTSYENVNSAFFEYMDRSKTGPMTSEQKERVLLADRQFFEGLSKGTSEKPNQETWVSLSLVSQERDKFFRDREIPKHSKYPQALLAKKLESMGFKRKRTNRGNLWNVDFSLLDNGLNPGSKCVILRGSGKLSLPSAGTQNQMEMQMTINVNDFDVKKVMVKLNKHPSEKRYCGRANRDSSEALTKLMALLPSESVSDLLEGRFVDDEEATAAEFDAMLPGDRVGIVLHREKEGWVPTLIELTKIENDVATGKDLYLEEEVSFTFEDVSAGLALTYFEILYRPDPAEPEKLVPYGIEREKEIKLLIPKEPDPNAAAPTAPVAAAPPAPPAAPPTTPEELAKAIAASGGVSLTPEQMEAVARAFGINPPTPPAPIPATEEAALASPEASESSTAPSNPEPSSAEELAGLLAGTGLGVDQIRDVADANGIDMTPTGPAVPARRTTES